MKRRNYYYVEGCGWFVVKANKRQAYSVGVSEFGRGGVRLVRKATSQETCRYFLERGIKALTP